MSKSIKDYLFGIVIKEVKGDFIGNDLGLNSIDGLPKIVMYSISLMNNNLTSLKGLPRTIDKNCWIAYNKLESLDGLPEIIKGNFSVSHNPELLIKYKNESLLIKYILENCDVGGVIYANR